MTRFFGGRKNQAENDFRRFEQEIYLNSAPRTPQHPHEAASEEDERFYAQSDINNRSYPPSLRQEQYQQQSPLRSQPSFRTAHATEAEDFGRLRHSRQNEYSRNAYQEAHRTDELKGLRFWQDDPEETTEEAGEWIERPSPFKFIVALIGLTVMVSILWFGYRWLSQPNAEGPVLIEAEPGPFKVKPENPGGVEIPYQDKLIYGRISPGTETPVERLLPPPEQPMAPPPPAAAHEQTNPQQTYNQQPQQYQQQSYHPSGVPLPSPPPSYPHPGQPTPVPTGEAYPAKPIGQQPHYPPAPTAPVPQPQNSQPYNEGQSQHLGYAPQQPAQPRAVAPIAPQTTAEAVAPEALPVNAKPGAGFYIQLGTLPTETAAKEELKRLRRKYRVELTDYEDRIEAFETAEGKKIYRALIGPFQKRNAALSKCNRLGSTCRVIQVP